MNTTLMTIATIVWVAILLLVVSLFIEEMSLFDLMIAPLVGVGGEMVIVFVGVTISHNRDEKESKRMAKQYEKDSIEFGKVLRRMKEGQN